MIAFASNRRSRTVVKGRQLEILQTLATHGLARGPRRLLGVPGQPAGWVGLEEAHSVRLRCALTSLGPVFASFGRYLSSRVDLLPVNYCMELAAIKESVPSIPIGSVREVLAQSFGYSADESFLAIEEEPCESRLGFQSHHGLLTDGTEVTIKIAHPELDEEAALDMELLPLLKEALALRKLTESQIDGAIADFRRCVEGQTDFDREAEALEALARDSEDFEMLQAPRVRRELSSRTVLTIQRLSGVNLRDVIAYLNAPERVKDIAARRMLELRVDRSHLSARLYRVWLRQALTGNCFPVEPHVENIVLFGERRIAFTGSPFANLELDTKKNLLSYMTAASTEDPDRACAALVKEMSNGDRRPSEDKLRQKFRQIVPFREGGWSNSGNCDSVGERMFVQWRSAGECGFQPPPHLISFYRGLFLIAGAARQLSPGRDPLLAEMEEVRLRELLAQFQELTGLRQLGNSVDKYAEMMIDLPKKLDDVLTMAAEGGARVKLRTTERPDQNRRKNSLAVVTALMVVLAAIALLSHRLTAISEVLGERVAAIVFLLIGALLLRVVTKRR